MQDKHQARKLQRSSKIQTLKSGCARKEQADVEAA
jgi:hypothetical protein